MPRVLGFRRPITLVTAVVAALATATATVARAPGPALAAPTSGGAGAGAPRLAAMVPAEDARHAVVIGAGGEVYEPDGNGAWVHRLSASIAYPVVAAGRAGGPRSTVVALGDGVVYRLAANGWSAIRLAQRGKAILGTGSRSLAAVGRQLFALDPLTQGEPTRLAVAPASVIAIGAGARGAVIATEAGMFRLEGRRLIALKALPAPLRLVSDRWAIADRGAVDLATSRVVAWPGDLAIGVAAAAPDNALAAIGTSSAGLELVMVRAGKLARDPLGVTGTAVGVTVDRAGRAAVALSDGRICVRARAGWTTTEVTSEPPAEHPGPPPAASS